MHQRRPVSCLSSPSPSRSRRSPRRTPASAPAPPCRCRWTVAA